MALILIILRRLLRILPPRLNSSLSIALVKDVSEPEVPSLSTPIVERCDLELLNSGIGRRLPVSCDRASIMKAWFFLRVGEWRPFREALTPKCIDDDMDFVADADVDDDSLRRLEDLAPPLLLLF